MLVDFAPGDHGKSAAWLRMNVPVIPNHRLNSFLLEALEGHGALLVDLVPQLAQVVGPQPPLAELPLAEARQRFKRLFQRFLGVFATAERPLVLFLDDLQWLDAGTLALLADLATHPDVRYLLLVGAYRDN